MSLTGTTDLAKYPPDQAAAASCWERIAHSSTSRREIPLIVASRSHAMPCGMK